jgi:uracil-DNA glycosylase
MHHLLPEPPRDCPLCPRLEEFRAENQAQYPGWFNAPVESFGNDDARLLIVGLAPGLKGANRTGRPFTGDYAGDLLYATLTKYGFAEGEYAATPDDGLRLKDCMITNAVRCVPPKNKPTGGEIRTCRPFLESRIATLPRLKVIMALGRIAHDSTLSALELKKSKFAFGHANAHEVGNGLLLFDSYHCSRYNTNTGRLTTGMFEAVFDGIRQHIPSA